MITDQDLARQRALDEQTIAALTDAGSNLKALHALEHHFVCRNKSAARAIQGWGREQGFSCSEMAEDVHAGGTYVYFDLIRATKIILEAITPVTTAMLEIADQHGADYDGWGCEAVV